MKEGRKIGKDERRGRGGEAGKIKQTSKAKLKPTVIKDSERNGAARQLSCPQEA